jgi:hypothetical protein
MDRLLGDEQRPMSRHRYLYAFDDAVNQTDPSGDATMWQGMRVHEEIGRDFELKGLGRFTASGEPCRISNRAIDTILETFGVSKRRPDLTDRCTYEVYEIKPVGSEISGRIQLGQYEDLLLGENRPGLWHAGTSYKPPDWVWIQAPIIGAEVFGPDDGMITYSVSYSKSPLGSPVGAFSIMSAGAAAIAFVGIAIGVLI